ncbi:MAG: VIT1/CCC1 transporter family protein [archaeon]
MNKFKRFLSEVGDYNKIASIDEIGRRYFAMNSFDGILTIIGVLIGSYIAHVTDPKIIISTGLGASIAMGISGTWGTYLTEDAERKKKLSDLGHLTLRNLEGTKLARAEHAATWIVALIDGLSPFLAAFIVIIPFFLSSFISVNSAYISSIAIAFILLALLGGFLGSISKENVFKYSLRMVLAGVVCAGVIMLLGHNV